MLSNRYLAAAVVFALIIVAGYNIQYFRNRSTRNAQQAVKTAAAGRTASLEVKDADSASKPVEVFEPADKTAWKRDPFALPRTKAGADSREHHLQAVLHRDGRSFALINGRVYRQNDRVGESLLAEIRKDRVVLTTEGQKQELFLDDIIPVKEKTR